jgi:hypothetical protein
VPPLPAAALLLPLLPSPLLPLLVSDAASGEADDRGRNSASVMRRSASSSEAKTQR